MLARWTSLLMRGSCDYLLSSAPPGNVSCDVRYPEAARNVCCDKATMGDEIVEEMKPAVQAAKAHGSLFIVQLTHAGRQTPEFVSPTPVSSSESQCPPLGGPNGVTVSS